MLGNGQTPGRGKRVRKEPQKRPLIVSAARSRVTERVAMSAVTARDLRNYVRWASKEAVIDEDEAMVLTLDRAIADLLKKDELYQSWKAMTDGGDDDEEPSRAPVTPPAVKGQ